MADIGSPCCGPEWVIPIGTLGLDGFSWALTGPLRIMIKHFSSLCSFYRSSLSSIIPIPFLLGRKRIMALFVIIVSIIILRRIISLVSIIIFNIIPGLFVMAFSGDYAGLTLGRGLSGGYKMRLAGRGIVDPVYAAISQRCFHSMKRVGDRIPLEVLQFLIQALVPTHFPPLSVLIYL